MLIRASYIPGTEQHAFFAATYAPGMCDIRTSMMGVDRYTAVDIRAANAAVETI